MSMGPRKRTLVSGLILLFGGCAPVGGVVDAQRADLPADRPAETGRPAAGPIRLGWARPAAPEPIPATVPEKGGDVIHITGSFLRSTENDLIQMNGGVRLVAVATEGGTAWCTPLDRAAHYTRSGLPACLYDTDGDGLFEQAAIVGHGTGTVMPILPLSYASARE